MLAREFRHHNTRNKALHNDARLLLLWPAPPLLAAGVQLNTPRRNRLWVVRSVVRKVHCPLHGMVVKDPPSPSYGNKKGLGAPLTIKARMGATHFLMKTLPKVATE